MKKLITLLLVLLLCGCSTSETIKVSNPNEVVVESGSVKYTKQDVFELMKNSQYAEIENSIFLQIAENYDIDLEEINESVEEYINMYISIGYQSYIEYYYGSIENYRTYMVNQTIVSELGKVYVEDHFDEMVKEHKPIQLQLVEFEERESAEALLADIANGSSFDMAAVKAGADQPQSYIYLDTDDIDIEIKDFLNSSDEIGLSTIIEVNSEDHVEYAVVNVLSRDVEEFKNEYLNVAATAIEEAKVKQYLLSKHEVKIHDQGLYDYMSKNYEVSR